ncbi:MAG: hypothetical protein GTN78_26070, partial [Gemmatimonadales bacterium]|nr:hypothetical protein [Gemmatimonadales bacterium]
CNPLYQGPALYVADPDGGDVMRVMTPPGTTWYGSQGCGAWPDLSADGRWVAFSSEDGLAVWEIDLALLGWTEEWNLPQVIWP